MGRSFMITIGNLSCNIKKNFFIKYEDSRMGSQFELVDIKPSKSKTIS